MSIRSLRKMHGCGNSFLVALANAVTAKEFRQHIPRLCSPSFGIGADGVMLIDNKGRDGFEVYMYNPADASLMGMCGNGIRCVARFVYEQGLVSEASAWIPFVVEGRVIECRIHEQGRQIEVNMGEPRFSPRDLPMEREKEAVDDLLKTKGGDFHFSGVSMGNPHCVIFVDDVAAINLPEIGPIIENHRDFPKRINAEFVSVVSPEHLKVRVWERGAGITLACGTGACASLVAAVRTERASSKARVELPGGSVNVEWDQTKNVVFMTGPAENIAEIELAPEIFS